jgi:hypothetical protein
MVLNLRVIEPKARYNFATFAAFRRASSSLSSLTADQVGTSETIRTSLSAPIKGPRPGRMYAGRGSARKKSREVAYSRRGCFDAKAVRQSPVTVRLGIDSVNPFRQQICKSLVSVALKPQTAKPPAMRKRAALPFPHTRRLRVQLRRASSGLSNGRGSGLCVPHAPLGNGGRIPVRETYTRSDRAVFDICHVRCAAKATKIFGAADRAGCREKEPSLKPAWPLVRYFRPAAYRVPGHGNAPPAVKAALAANCDKSREKPRATHRRGLWKDTFSIFLIADAQVE